MEEKAREMLRAELDRLQTKLDEFEPDSDEYTKVFHQYMRVHQLLNTYGETENASKANRNELIKAWVDVGLGIISVGSSTALALWMANAGFKFEETGSFCSKTFQWLIPKFLLNKK